MLDQFHTEREPYDEDALEEALDGGSLKALLKKALERKEASLRMQERNREMNRQAMLSAEKAGV